jgi:hypothetical protein
MRNGTITTAASPGNSFPSTFRKAVLQHRIALETTWPLAFPHHNFSDLRLIRFQAEPIVPWPNEEAWAASARAYHDERKRGFR